MAADPNNGTSNQDTRTRILDATERIMLEEGYAGVSSRKVAARAGLKSKLLHYYFATMDDLFIAAFQRREDWHIARFASIEHAAARSVGARGGCREQPALSRIQCARLPSTARS
jgi:AcrR family transcriptional regulator